MTIQLSQWVAEKVACAHLWVKISKETSALFKMTYAVHAMKKCVFLSATDNSRNGEMHIDTKCGPHEPKRTSNGGRVWAFLHSCQRLNKQLITEELNINR